MNSADMNIAATPDMNHNSNKTYTINSSGPSGVSVNVKQHHEQQRITHEQVTSFTFTFADYSRHLHFSICIVVQSSSTNGR